MTDGETDQTAGRLNRQLDIDKEKLKPDCAACDALCCITPRFEAPDYQKPLGVRCRNLDSQTLGCRIYQKREALGYIFCLKFDCFGAGQAVSRLFRDLASDWQGEESIERFKFDVFVLLYTQISNHLFPGRQLEMEADPESAEKLKPFLEAAVNLLGQDS